jgi:hypothetical protein
VLSRCPSPLGAAFGDELLLVTCSRHHRPTKPLLQFLSLAADKIKAFDDSRYFLRRERHISQNSAIPLFWRANELGRLGPRRGPRSPWRCGPAPQNYDGEIVTKRPADLSPADRIVPLSGARVAHTNFPTMHCVSACVSGRSVTAAPDARSSAVGRLPRDVDFRYPDGLLPWPPANSQPVRGQSRRNNKGSVEVRLTHAVQNPEQFLASGFIEDWRRPQLEGNARGIGQRVMRGDDEVMRVLLEVEDECGGLPSGRVRSSVRFGAPTAGSLQTA